MQEEKKRKVDKKNWKINVELNCLMVCLCLRKSRRSKVPGAPIVVDRNQFTEDLIPYPNHL